MKICLFAVLKWTNVLTVRVFAYRSIFCSSKFLSYASDDPIVSGRTPIASIDYK